MPIPKTALLLAALLAAAPALAEEPRYNLLQFEESAAVNIPNDTMNVVLKIEHTHAARQTAADTVTRRVNAVLARARNNKTFKIETLGRSVYPDYDDKRRIRGWTDSARLRIESRDFDALSKLMADSHDEAMYDQLYFSVSPQAHAKAVEQAAAQALDSFKQRAQNISRSLGFSGYKIVRLHLNQSFSSTDNRAEGMMGLMAAPAAAKRAYAADAMQTEAGTQEIRQTVQATVEMQ